VLGVVGQQRVAELDDGADAFVGEPVVDGAVLAARLDEAAPAQAGEVVRDARLAGAERFDETWGGRYPMITQAWRPGGG
jgi:hypothetical protein